MTRPTDDHEPILMGSRARLRRLRSGFFERLRQAMDHPVFLAEDESMAVPVACWRDARGALNYVHVLSYRQPSDRRPSCPMLPRIHLNYWYIGNRNELAVSLGCKTGLRPGWGGQMTVLPRELGGFAEWIAVLARVVDGLEPKPIPAPPHACHFGTPAEPVSRYIWSVAAWEEARRFDGDLPTWGLPAAPRVTMRLMRMLAAVHGQTWNGAALGRSLGLDAKTLVRYVDFLEGAYLVRRLPPYHANLKKRLVKAPKLYWRDSGLVHALLGVETEGRLLAQPWVGASFECHVIEQILGHLGALGHRAEPHYLRTHDGHELDLVLEVGGSRWAIEIKLTTQPDRRDLQRLEALAEAIGAERRILLSRSSQVVESKSSVVCDLAWLLGNLGRLLRH